MHGRFSQLSHDSLAQSSCTRTQRVALQYSVVMAGRYHDEKLVADLKDMQRRMLAEGAELQSAMLEEGAPDYVKRLVTNCIGWQAAMVRKSDAVIIELERKEAKIVRYKRQLREGDEARRAANERATNGWAPNG